MSRIFSLPIFKVYAYTFVLKKYLRMFSMKRYTKSFRNAQIYVRNKFIRLIRQALNKKYVPGGGVGCDGTRVYLFAMCIYVSVGFSRRYLRIDYA